MACLEANLNSLLRTITPMAFEKALNSVVCLKKYPQLILGNILSISAIA